MKIRDISDLDKNFEKVGMQEDVRWYETKESAFRLTGVYFDDKTKMYRRFPKDIKGFSGNIVKLGTHTVGGRLSFITNSPVVAIKAVVPYAGISTRQPIASYYGFGVYADNLYLNSIYPEVRDIVKCDDIITFEYEEMQKIPVVGFCDVYKQGLQDGFHQIDIFFPSYNGVLELFVGLKENSEIKPPLPFACDRKLVFYGSSIVQGGCVSHSGNDYVSMIARRLNVDILNLGFSGNCKGEESMAEFISSIDAKLYYIAYDHNASSIEELNERHYAFYEVLRKKNKTIPIIFESRPNYLPTEDCQKRREIVKNTYLKAKAQGDSNVYFIDGKKFFKNQWKEDCTVDGCHPNDLGFFKMAEYILPTIEKFLQRKQNYD